MPGSKARIFDITLHFLVQKIGKLSKCSGTKHETISIVHEKKISSEFEQNEASFRKQRRTRSFDRIRKVEKVHVKKPFARVTS